MNVILLLARLILAVVFGIAGIAKLADPAGSRKSIVGIRSARSPLAIPLAWLLPLAELVCAAALIPLASAWWGATGVLILLLSFIAGISISLIRGRRPDCHCFGQLHSSPIGWQTLVRNVVLAGISAWIVWQGRENPGASLLTAAGMSGTDFRARWSRDRGWLACRVRAVGPGPCSSSKWPPVVATRSGGGKAGGRRHCRRRRRACR